MYRRIVLVFAKIATPFLMLLVDEEILRFQLNKKKEHKTVGKLQEKLMSQIVFYQSRLIDSIWYMQTLWTVDMALYCCKG